LTYSQDIYLEADIITKRCKRCLIPENYPNTKLNKNRICNLCLEEKPADNPIEKMEYKQEFKKYIKRIKGKKEYDCLLLFSGGKDSTYLLHILKEEYDLKVLAVTVDTGLLSHENKLNIKKIIKFFDVDHMTIAPENNFYKKLYRYLIQHRPKKTTSDRESDTYCERICILCSKVINSVGLNIAAKKKIPFVALAYSPDQFRSYEFPRKTLCKSWVPEELYQEPFTEKDRSYFWNPENKKIIPRLILPFYFIDYPGTEKIIEKLSNIGLGKKRDFNTLHSNCYLVWLLMMLDLKNYNFNPYELHISRQIRQGKTKRSKWSKILPIGNWLLKNGFIYRKKIKCALNYLDLDIKDL
jgi:hypothetical protein